MTPKQKHLLRKHGSPAAAEARPARGATVKDGKRHPATIQEFDQLLAELMPNWQIGPTVEMSLDDLMRISNAGVRKLIRDKHRRRCSGIRRR